MSAESTRAVTSSRNTDDGPGEGRAATAHQGAPSALMPILTALGTGLGLLGFVAFFGGAILWTQADSAGLPASETVALVPKSVLLSTGAHFLTSAILLALFSVAVLWVYDEQLRRRSLGAATRLEEELTAEMARLRELQERAIESLDAAEQAHNLATRAATAALEVAESAPDNPTYQVAVEETASTRVRLEQEREKAKQDVDEVSNQVEVHTPRLEAETAAIRARLENRERWSRLTLLGVPLFIVELALTTFAALAWYDYLALAALSAATVAIILIVYAETDNFIWFAVSAFLAIGLYMGFATYFRTRDNPKAEPAAALVDQRIPVAGYFIAQTSDRIYLGIPKEGATPARMVALRRSDVVALAIGQSVPIQRGEAVTAAKALATSLCADLSTRTADVQLSITRSASPVCAQVAPRG